MLESDKRYQPEGGNGLQFRSTFAINFPEAFDVIPQEPEPMPKPEPFSGHLDEGKIFLAIVNREYVNRLMGF